MKKKIYTFLIMGALIMTTAFTGCSTGKANTSETGANEQKETIANPWVDTTAEDIMSKIGIELNVPEGAESVVYRMDESEKMEEMRFILDECEYTARAMQGES